MKKKDRTSKELDVADCCASLEEARDVIRRRERCVDKLMKTISERLRPLCSKPKVGNVHNICIECNGYGRKEVYGNIILCDSCNGSGNINKELNHQPEGGGEE